MKKRNGFVSNSSSSSFIVNLEDYNNNVFDLAREMVSIREWEDDEELLKKIDNFEKNESGNVGIFFNTCNYETFISHIGGGYVFVDTCNNHNWDSIKTSNVPEHLKSFFEEESMQYGEYYFKEDNKKSLKLLSLYNGIKGVKTNWDEQSRCCFTPRWKVLGTEVCPTCGKDKDGNIFKIFQRLDKLNRINKK